jgi:carbon monoxide dehydrogenase subunit G
MKLEQSFEVSAPIERVWQALVDVEHVAPCLPGAAVTGRNEDGTYNGTFSIKIGPTSAAYAGKLEMKDVDENAHAATMHAHGNDKRGQGGADATIVSKVVEVKPGETRVDVATDYHITGRLARFGRGGMIEDISERLLREFAQRLQASLVAEPETLKPDAQTPPADTAPDSAEAKDVTSGAAEAEPEPAIEPDAAGAEAESASAEPPPPPPKPSAPPPPPEPSAPPPPEPTAQPIEPSEPMQGAHLVGSVLWQRARRNPSPIVLALALLLAFVLLRRRQT